VVDDFGEFSEFSKFGSKDCCSFLVVVLYFLGAGFEENSVSCGEFDDDLSEFVLLCFEFRNCLNNDFFKLRGSTERVFDKLSLTDLGVKSFAC